MFGPPGDAPTWQLYSNWAQFRSYPEAACGMLRQHCENFDNTRWQHLSQCNFLWNLFSELYSEYSEMTVASGNTCLSYILRLCALGHASAYSLEGYKTVLILETPIWVAGAAESMKIGIIVIG